MASIGITGVSDRVNGVLSGGTAPRVAEWILVILLGVLIGTIFWKLLAPLPLPKGDALAAATSSNRANNAETLVVRSPFPKAEVAAGPAETAPDVEETSLDLTLTGVWPGNDFASAIISKPDGKQETFVIGDEIVPGVTLIAVYSDQVIIEQNGVRESLRFESKARVPSRVRAQPRGTPAMPAEVTPPVARLQSIFSFGAVRDSSGEAAIGVFAGSESAQFRRMGFRDGDVLRSINGAPTPQDPAALMQLMQQIAQAGEADIVVERNGEDQSLSLSFNELGSE